MLSNLAPQSTALDATAINTMKIPININEKDIVKLIIEFLANRELNISMLDLERETGIINAALSDDILFLRQLILDGQWDDAIEFIQPLKQIDQFNSKQFHFLILKFQYLELLCLKSEANVGSDNQLSVDQLVSYLNDLRQFCPSEDEYKKLCLLLTSPRLQDHTEFKAWNPSSGRLQCFKEILPLVNKFLTPSDTNGISSNKQSISQNERLVQLIVKGLLYESCVEYCQARATSSIEAYNLSDPNVLLMQMQLSETDASLLSWLHALPIDTFSCPFEEKPLKLNMSKFVKPSLEAAWADAILATPIKPQQLFPYNAVPSGRSRNTELMSRSLAPQYEGLSFGLSRSQIFTSATEMQLNPLQHQLDQNQQHQQLNNGQTNSNPRRTNQQIYQRDLNDMTRSIALFNLEMPVSSTSVASPQVITTNASNDDRDINLAKTSLTTNGATSMQQANNYSLSNSYMSRYNNLHPVVLNGIKEEEPAMINSTTASTSTSPSTEMFTALLPTSGMDAPSNHKPIPSQYGEPVNSVSNRLATNTHNPMNDSSLFKEYQKNKAQIIQQLEEQEKKRSELVKQLKSPNIQNALNAVSKSTVAKNSLKLNDLNNATEAESFLSPKFQRRVTSTHNNNDSTVSNRTGGVLSPISNPDSPPSNQFSSGSANSASSGNNNNNNMQQSPTAAVAAVTTPTNEVGGGVNLNSSKSSNSLNQKSKIAPSYHQHQNNNNHQQFNSDTVNNSSLRPINEATKFDSLEDITKAASFQSVCIIEDQQAIRAVDIHPSGNYFVVGSNSKCLRICPYPNLNNIKNDNPCKPASVLYKKSKHHYGSIYCSAWNPSGNLIATGSNDKTIKLLKFTPDLVEDTDSEIELTYHNGTVRDLIFMQQEDNNILISGGAGDCKIHVLDCQTQQSLRVYTGHSGHVYSLYTWSSTKNVFVSGSQDKTCRFWDLRAPEAIQTITPSTTLAFQGSPVAAVAVDPSGLLLSSGHEDAACCLYDIRGSRIVQIYKPHTSDIRSVRFSTNAYYLLTASYDNKVIITDLHGDLTKPLNWSIVAQHNDKIIQARWHPTQMSFVTTSADRTSIVWSLPTSALASASVI